MFIVKNVSNQDVELPDLHIVLSSKDQIDLDMVTSRFHSEQSRSLKGAFRGGYLKVIVKDDHRGDYQIKTDELSRQQPIFITPPDPNKNQDVIEAVKQLEEKLAKRLDDKLSNTPQQPQIDLAALTQALTVLQNLANQAVKPAATEKVEEASDERVVDIHKRTLDRLSKDAQSNVKHTEETADNSSVQRNIDELEGLL
jgi:hypothetical protein